MARSGQRQTNRQIHDAEGAIEQASEAIAEGRDAVHQLRSAALSQVDLGEAIGNFGKDLVSGQPANAPQLFVQVAGEPRALNPIVRDEVYRIGIEALRNAVRHADARRIEIEIQYGEQELRLRIRDDGKGIDSAVLTRDHPVGHWGLHGMRERTKLVGGTFDVWSQPGNGTEIELNIPAANAYVASSTSRMSLFSRLWSK